MNRPPKLTIDAIRDDEARQYYLVMEYRGQTLYAMKDGDNLNIHVDLLFASAFNETEVVRAINVLKYIYVDGYFMYVEIMKCHKCFTPKQRKLLKWKI